MTQFVNDKGRTLNQLVPTNEFVHELVCTLSSPPK